MKLSPLLIAALLGLGACGGNHIGDDAGNGDGNGNGDTGPCQGLACYQTTCPNAGTTSISGIVYAPNGWLPLSGVNVYVPNAAVPDITDGVSCDQCSASLPGNPLVQTTTDTTGHFSLTNMPATSNVPLVIQIGRWRRQFTIPAVASCTDTPLNADDIRLPRTHDEGHIPRIALTTGGADALECLLRKIGIADTEFGTKGDADKRIHLYSGNQTSSGGGTPKFDNNTDSGKTFGVAKDALWDSETDLHPYDIVLFSCEGDQNTADKPQPAIDAVNQFANEGGRVFASHWHNYWLQAPASAAVGETRTWDMLATWPNGGAIGSMTATVNQGFGKGATLAQWLVNVNASTTLGSIDLLNSKHTLSSIDEANADKWVYNDNPPDGNGPSVQYFSFTTNQDLPENQRCGRVVFSDIHVTGAAGGDSSNAGESFPSGGCTTDVNTMSPQEKVLAFMFFDIASCVGQPPG